MIDQDQRKTRRVFLAIEPSDEIRKSIGELSQKLQKASIFTPIKASWVPTDNFHVTLFFLGDIEPENLDRLTANLSTAAADVPPFEMDYRKIGYFPPDNRGPARVIWLGIHRPDAQITHLRKNCASLIAKSGLIVPEQDFSPHITLGRFKSTKGLADFQKIAAEYQDVKLGKSTVTRLVLMESITGKGPAIYKPFETAELKG